MGHCVIALSYPVMQKHLLNANDPPLMSRVVVKPSKSTPILKIKLSQFWFPRVDVTTTRRTQTVMKLKLETKKYVSLSLDFDTN